MSEGGFETFGGSPFTGGNVADRWTNANGNIAKQGAALAEGAMILAVMIFAAYLLGTSDAGMGSWLVWTGFLIYLLVDHLGPLAVKAFSG